MKILKFDIFNETRKVTIKDLQATSPLGTVGDVLVDKLKKQVVNPKDPESIIPFSKISKIDKSVHGIVEKPIENAEEIIDNITDGEEKTFDFEKAKRYFTYGARPSYHPRFDVEQDVYKLNDIPRTKEWGSSSGTSLGSEKTTIVESIQCLYFALRQSLGRDIKTLDLDLLFDEAGEVQTELLRYIRVPIKLTRELVEEFSNEWYQNFILTSNSVFSSKPLYSDKRPGIRLRVTKSVDSNDNLYRILSPTKKYIFYQIEYKLGLSGTINSKYGQFKYCKQIPIEKWNPSDVWVVEQSQESVITDMINRVSDSETSRGIDNLNDIVDRLFMEKKMVGISLKKVTELENPKLLINKVTPRPSYKFLKVRTSSVALNSLGVHVILQQISDLPSECRTIAINFRTFGSSTSVSDISGEVIGDTARHGKISLYWLNYIFSKFQRDTKINVGRVETYKELADVSDDKLREEIIKMNAEVGDRGDELTNSRPEEKVANRRRYVSKYQALKLSQILYKIKDVDEHLELEDFDRFSNVLCKEIMHYALAIKNDVFECPIYVRVL